MKKNLLPEVSKSYKANLHCHSTCSDGQMTPAQLKEEYRSQGYSVLAISDHEILLDHSDLNDESFLLLNSYEMSIGAEEKDGPHFLKKTCHINLIAKDPNNLKQVCFHPLDLWGNAKTYAENVQYDGVYEKKYNAECVNHIIKTANDNGFLVSYNHPAWSLENAFDYTAYNGFFAMEIYNTTCINSGLYDYNLNAYLDMLRAGKRLYCMATDDAHRPRDLFGGFIMIHASELEYKTIIKALENGDFYASTGPLIHSLYSEDGRIFLECDPVQEVIINTAGRNAQRFCADDKNGFRTLSFDAELKDSQFFQISLFDGHGNAAYTRAYFADECL